MINVKELRYTYTGSPTETLRGLDFEIAESEIFGFLGPSGAGKSTTLNILIGLLQGYQGQVTVMGKSVQSWGQDYYQQVGISFESPNHYLKLSGRENLEHFRGMFSGQTEKVDQVLDWVGLLDDADKKVEEYSKGMKIRLNVARSILHKPKVLFLDEPTNGLDPANARKIKDLIHHLCQQGTTVFITTHNMMVADELCDRVAFITTGQIRLIDAPGSLKKEYGKRLVTVEYLNGGEALQSEEFKLDGLGQDAAFSQLLKTARRIETIHTQETTLDNIFIEVTGQELDR